MSDLYTVWTKAGVYCVVKFDFLLNVQAVYNLPIHKGRMSCQCFQKDKPSCRHREMVNLFVSYKRINRGYFYCYDKDEWQLPVTEAFKRVQKMLNRSL